MKKQLLEWEGTLYEVVATIRESHNPVIQTWKEHLNADTVLRKDDFLYFCRKVEEAQIISDEEIKSEEIKLDEYKPKEE